MYFANVIFLFVVIHTTVYARYLLVELQNEEHEETAQFLAKATCDATRYAWATTIVSTCPGYKLLHTSSNPITAYTMCCEAVKADPECGNSWFKGPVSGKCFCEKKGYDCIRTAGLYTEYRFKKPESEKFLPLQTRELLSSPARGKKPTKKPKIKIPDNLDDACELPINDENNLGFFCCKHKLQSDTYYCKNVKLATLKQCEKDFPWACNPQPMLKTKFVKKGLDQCAARTEHAPNPWDNCNRCQCKNGCFTGGCTKVGCPMEHRFENELCSLKHDECDAGLKCTDVKDGCKNDVGRCKKGIGCYGHGC